MHLLLYDLTQPVYDPKYYNFHSNYKQYGKGK